VSGQSDPSTNHWSLSCSTSTETTTSQRAFEVTSKRRKGFPSETNVKRGDRTVGGGKELAEKLGRDDPCPCGSARLFQALLLAQWVLLTA
jgi:uncharacterized protein YecA (UPF0149 family)